VCIDDELHFTYHYGQPLDKKKTFIIKLSKQVVSEEIIFQRMKDQFERKIAKQLTEQTDIMERLKANIK
jgi:hypothetical protein